MPSALFEPAIPALGRTHTSSIDHEAAGIGCLFNPLNAELNPICHLLVLLELTMFSTLAG